MHPRILLLAFALVCLLVILTTSSHWPAMGCVRSDLPLPSACSAPRVQSHIERTPVVMITTVTEPSFQISLHPQSYDPLRWRIAESGQYYDTKLTSIARRFLEGQPRSLVVDVGANIGWLSLYAMAMGHNVVRYEAVLVAN